MTLGRVRLPAAERLRGRSGALLLAIVIVVGVAVGRLLIGGWEALSPDHARYVFSGMSLLDGRGYLNESRGPFLIRSPAYPILVGGAFRVGGHDAAHLASWLLGVSAMLLAVGLAWRLAGAPAAIVAAGAVVAVPLFWEQAVSLGIDLPGSALFLAAVWLVLRPTGRRWLAGGAVLGLAVLVKETVAPAAALLPIAWLPIWSAIGWRRWLGLTLLFGGAVVAVAGWWWVVVWLATGLIFPLNALEAIVRDEEVAAASVRPARLVVGFVAVAGWAAILVRCWRQPEARVLLAALLSMAPAAVAAIALAQPARNVAIIALLTCAALGVAGADAARWFEARLAVGRPAVASIGAVVAIAAIAAAAAFGQAQVAPAADDLLPGRVAALVRPGLSPGEAVVSTFRYRSALGVELFEDEVRVALIPLLAVERAGDPGRFLWLGERRGTLFGVTRAGWQRSLGSQRAEYLVVATPHPLSPAELIPALRDNFGRDAGLTYLGELTGPSGAADVFRVHPAQVDAIAGVPLHARADALLHWLDLAAGGGPARAARMLIDAGPVVPARSDGLRALSDRLGPDACFLRRREAGTAVLAIERAEDQTGCVPIAELPA